MNRLCNQFEPPSGASLRGLDERSICKECFTLKGAANDVVTAMRLVGNMSLIAQGRFHDMALLGTEELID